MRAAIYVRLSQDRQGLEAGGQQLGPLTQQPATQKAEPDELDDIPPVLDEDDEDEEQD